MAPEKVNFQDVICQLNEWGINDTKLAEMTGVQRTMILRLRKGERQQPNYNDGAAIVEVYNKQKKANE